MSCPSPPAPRALLLLALLGAACDAAEPGRPAPGSFTMTLAGRHALQASGPAHTRTFTLGAPTRQILLGDGYAPGVSFFRSYDTTFVPGPYAIGAGIGGVHASVTVAGSELLEATDGLLTVTRAGQGRLAGTFRFRAFPHFDTTAAPTLVEGRFEARLP